MARANQKLLLTGQKIRILVVDDSVVIRRLITQALEQVKDVEVVGVASNGKIALERIEQWHPDVVTLDIEMPEMNGLETLQRMRRLYPEVRVIMFSTLTARGAAVTIEALTLGADDYVTKVSNEGSLDRSMARLREELVPKVRQFFRRPGEGAPAQKRAAETRVVETRVKGGWESSIVPPTAKAQPRVLAIGVSTGGPAALAAILPAIPASFPLPVLIVQHMPPMFTRLLAERLNSICQMPVAEASLGEAVEAGKILVGPGDFHLKVVGDRGAVRVSLDQAAPMNSCRPAVDALFESVAAVYGGEAVAVVLTGMGQDGLKGAQVLRAQGATILAQDEATSVVWGMPGAVTKAGAADRVLPLDRVVPEILEIVGHT